MESVVNSRYSLWAAIEGEVGRLGAKAICERRVEEHGCNPVSNGVFTIEVKSAIEVPNHNDKIALPGESISSPPSAHMCEALEGSILVRWSKGDML